MPPRKNFLRLVDTSSEISGAPLVGVELLHQGPVRPRDVLGGRSRLQAKDLIGLLLGHRSVQATASAHIPRTRVSLCVLTPGGRPAVEISFE